MLSSYPDYGKAPAEYLLAVTEFMAILDPSKQSAIADMRTGIPSQCKFLPTIADLAQFVENAAKAKDRFKTDPPRGPYAYFPKEPEMKRAPEETRVEHAQRLVAELRLFSESIHAPPKLRSDPNAEWRKPGPPSEELRRDVDKYNAHMAEVLKGMEGAM